MSDPRRSGLVVKSSHSRVVYLNVIANLCSEFCKVKFAIGMILRPQIYIFQMMHPHSTLFYYSIEALPGSVNCCNSNKFDDCKMEQSIWATLISTHLSLPWSIFFSNLFAANGNVAAATKASCGPTTGFFPGGKIYPSKTYRIFLRRQQHFSGFFRLEKSVIKCIREMYSWLRIHHLRTM